MRIPKKKREDVLDQIEDASESLGLGDRWYARSRGNVSLEESYGLCATCNHKTLIKTKYNIKLFRCGNEDMILSTDDPVTECTSYERVGTLTLQSMSKMAHLIDVDKRIKPGFC